jgi:hypothetical protein
VHCSKCGAENPSSKKFCGDCGAPLANLCSKCRADNPSGKRFYGECDAALAASPAVPFGKLIGRVSYRVSDALEAGRESRDSKRARHE